MKIFFSLFLFLTLLNAKSYEVVIPQKVLQERVSSSFPIVQETLFLTFKVTDPKIALDGVKQRFNFKAKLLVPNIRDDKGRVVSAVVTLSSRIAYSKGGKLYLRKIKVVKIESDYIPKDMRSMLYGAIESALNDYFKKEIYNLKDEKGMVGSAVSAIKSVKIVDGGIKITFDF